jgi:hypothetical protein
VGVRLVRIQSLRRRALELNGLVLPSMRLESDGVVNAGVEEDVSQLRAVPNIDYQSRYFLVLVLHTGCYRVDQSKERTE